MRKLPLLKNKKGFTFTELLFVAVISWMVVGALLAVWIFTQKVWIERTHAFEDRPCESSGDNKERP